MLKALNGLWGQDGVLKAPWGNSPKFLLAYCARRHFASCLALSFELVLDLTLSLTFGLGVGIEALCLAL